MPDTRLAALLLTNRLTRGGASPLRAREFWTLVERADAANIELGTLLGADTSTFADLADDEIDAERLGTLLGATRALAFEIERLGEGGITLVSALDKEFPGLLRDRLHHGCPPSLFIAGPVPWLHRNGLAIVGDDDAVPAAHDIARVAAAAAVVAGRSSVIGHLSLIGDTVVDEVVACDGAVVAIPADGINRAGRSPATRKLVQDGHLCLASPFPPDAAASASATRARDGIIHALADISLVITVHDGTGGTWRAAFEAVEREPASIATWLGSGSQAGNRALADLGARTTTTPDDLYTLAEQVP